MTTPRAAFTSDFIPWDDAAPDGTKYALLEGRRDIDGELFTYAFFIPAGFWDAAHWHTQDARVVVLSGSLYLGYGDLLEVAKAERFEAGSVLVVPAGERHFDGSLEDTVIVGVARGVWATHYVDSSVTPSAGTVS
jgi:uncharacterized RmlC-like cupin family protein